MRCAVIFILLLFYSCKNEQSSTLEMSAQAVVDQAIAISGGETFNNSSIGFQFRNAYYTASRDNGDFAYSRIQLKDSDSVIDILSNDGFARFINNEFQKIPDSIGLKYSASVNSVHYFSVLPYGLNDPAVRKRLLESEMLNEVDYYKIEVTFDAEGGGEDYEDVFIYWVNKLDYKVDYIAYSYAEEDGVGMRFREAYNERYVEGLRFVDYKNYKPKVNNLELFDLANHHKNGNLDLISTIELEQVKVQLIHLK